MRITISSLPISLLFANVAVAFVTPSPTHSGIANPFEQATTATTLLAASEDTQEIHESSRRQALHGMMALATGTNLISLSPSEAYAEESIFAPKFVQEYEDFQATPEGWSFRDVKVGDGPTPKNSDRVVYDWSGYTIGYFGRPFEAKGWVATDHYDDGFSNQSHS